LNLLKHPIDIGQNVVVPKSQNAVPVRLKHLGASCILVNSCRMLTAVDLDHELRRVTCKVSQITSNSHLATKMRALHLEAMAKVPPKFALCVRRFGTHLTRKRTLGQSRC